MSTKRLSILGGAGVLPLLVLRAAADAGWIVQYLSFVPRPELEDVVVTQVEPSKPLQIVLAVRRFKSTHLCAAGGLKVSDKNREGAFRLLGAKKRKVRTSGDTGLSKIGKAAEIATGAKLVGAHEIMPDLLAENGLIAGPNPSRELVEDGLFALETAISAGGLDLGQAVVCAGHRVIALEDVAGTDALLQRVAQYRADGLVGDGSSVLVLAKAKKPAQPMFADLPAIGPDTVQLAHDAGVVAVFVEAGKSIILEREALVALSQKLGVVVYGHHGNA